MAFSIIQFLERLFIGLVIGGIIGIPITYIIWKLKMRKIKKKMLKEGLEEKIKLLKADEKEVEDERKRRRDTKESRRNQRAADVFQTDTGESVEVVPGRRPPKEYSEVPKITPIRDEVPDKHPKQDWPIFE